MKDHCDTCKHGLICTENLMKHLSKKVEQTLVNAPKLTEKNFDETVRKWYGDCVVAHRGKTDDETQNKWDEEERKFRESVNRGLSEMDGGYYPDYDETTESLIIPPLKKSPPCECGADKCELPYHSHWCPKAKEGV